MSEFYAGQKVVCVDDMNYYPNIHPNGLPKRGEICTAVSRSENGGWVLREYPVISIVTGRTSAFMWFRFRPIDSLTEQMARIEEEGAPMELEPEYA